MSKIVNLGKISDLAINSNGKIFIGEALDLTSAEISVNVMPANTKPQFSHKHIQNEEIYIFTKGSGKMIIDGKVIDVLEGSCVKVEPEEARAVESISELEYICIQAKKGSLKQAGLKDATLC